MYNKDSFMFAFKIFGVCIFLSFLIFILCIGMYDDIKEELLQSVFYKSDVCSVIIDAGHGGRDGGASSKSGILEKELNLEVAFCIRDILRICGVSNILTRENDKLVCDENDSNLKGNIKMTDLKNRLAISSENPNALFISIHMNKFSVEKYSGMQVYYSPNNNQSYGLAKTIQDNVKEHIQPNNSRKVKKAGNNIYLLDRISSPAVLIECGFLSNIEESSKLADPMYQVKLSLVICNSIMTNLN